MAELVVSFTLETLRQLLVEKGKLLYRVCDQIEEIRDELKLIQSFLKDADAKQAENGFIRSLVANITEVSYEAEDIIATFAVEVAIRKRRGGGRNIFLVSTACFMNGINGIIARFKVVPDVENIKSKIIKLTTELQSYGVISMMGREESSSHQQRRGELRRSYSHVVEEEVVGFEEEVQILVAQLVNEDKSCRVVSICGMGGLGKTTLAGKIYHHQDVRHHFDAFAWMCISQQWEKNVILQNILAILIPEKKHQVATMTDQDLVKQLYEVQQQKKCLVVLDDIWSIDAWNSLSPAFPSTKMRGKILLTTRKEDVARIMDPSGFLYNLNYLSKENSWELFQKKAFSRRDGTDFKVDTRMEMLGREMVEQCQGLPLAIVALGGLLMTKNTLSEWEKVKQNMSKGEGGIEERVLEVLAPSYHDLPYRLKACFLHLGNYPNGYKIETESLYQLWIAEGIVSSSEDMGEEQTMLAVAEDYLGELAERGMVMVQQVQTEESYTKTRKFKSLWLHDLMRDLCLSKIKEENFLHVIDYEHKQIKKSSSSSFMSTLCSSNSKIHRLAIHLDPEVYEYPSFKQEKNIRSVMFFNGKKCNKTFWEKMKSQFPKGDFKLAKVLNLDGFGTYFCEAIELPRSIGDLIHLRYLSLRGSLFKELPPSIGNLRYLQTLDLRAETKFGIPNVLWKMEELRHLYLPLEFYCLKCRSLKMDGLSKLETLINFDSSLCNVNDLFNLTNLRQLEQARARISLEDLATMNKYLGRVSNQMQQISISLIDYDFGSEEASNLLRQLFECNGLSRLDIVGIIRKLPESNFCLCSNIIFLTLQKSQLEQDPMATLEKLPNLRVLHLFHNAFEGKEMYCSMTGFPQLRYLRLAHLNNLEKWTVEEGAMPNLSTLQMTYCNELEMLPDGLRFITTLQVLDIMGMSDTFKDRIRVVDGREGEDFHKVQHVHSITT